MQGPDAADLLQRVVSNDVLDGEACEALLLTPKGRVIAPLVVWRRGEDDFLLLTEPELGETVRDQLTRARIASRCEIELEEHTSAIVFGDADGIPTRDYGVPAVEVLDAGLEASPPDEELERLRILARTPRWGREIDDGILPAEAGLDERAVSFTKGCYPGQEPLARLHNRGHVNRTLRVLELDGEPRSARPRRCASRTTSSAGSRARFRGSRSPTSVSRCPTAPRSRSRAAGPGYTDLPAPRQPRARSSGDRALPCGGRGRKFESCRAHSPHESTPCCAQGMTIRAEILCRAGLQPRSPCQARPLGVRVSLHSRSSVVPAPLFTSSTA